MPDPRPLSPSGEQGSGVVQVTAVARDCGGPLSDVGLLAAACGRAAERAGLQVVGEATHAFVPHGATIVVLLAQSHLVVSTWPEYALAIVDISMCGPDSAAARAWAVLEDVLRPGGVEMREHRVDLMAAGKGTIS